MAEVISWLTENGLEELIEVFTREKINTLRRVRRLTEELIKEFIPEVGPRADFLECWAVLKAAEGEVKKLTVLGKQNLGDLVLQADESIVDDSVILKLDQPENDDQSILTDENGCLLSVVRVEVDKNHEANSVTTSSYSSPASLTTSTEISRLTKVQLKRKHGNSFERPVSKHLLAWKGLENLKALDLKQLLQNDLSSDSALNYYERNGCLTEAGRQAITTVVARELIRINSCPSSAEYKLITQKLCELFPHEDSEIYYCEPVDSHKNSTGKLPNKVRNIKYSLAKLNTGPISRPNKEITTDLAEPSTSTSRCTRKLIVKPAKLLGSIDKNNSAIQSAIITLKHRSSDSWPELLEKWSATHALRFEYLRATRPLLSESQKSAPEVEDDDGDTILVHGYFNEWSILAAPNGHLLICQDFSELYPGRENGLLAKWDSCKNFIVDLATKELSKSSLETQQLLASLEKCPEDMQDVTIFHLMLSLCCKRGRGKGASKVHSLSEARKSFSLHVKIPGDVQREIRNHRQLVKTLGLRLQPLLLFVGPSLSEITTSYVQIDHIKYKLRTPLAALDTCFKAFHALDAAYPAESQAAWLFIQRFFYDLNLVEDANISRVTTVICSLNSLQSNLQQGSDK